MPRSASSNRYCLSKALNRQSGPALPQAVTGMSWHKGKLAARSPSVVRACPPYRRAFFPRLPPRMLRYVRTVTQLLSRIRRVYVHAIEQRRVPEDFSSPPAATKPHHRTNVLTDAEPVNAGRACTSALLPFRLHARGQSAKCAGPPYCCRAAAPTHSRTIKYDETMKPWPRLIEVKRRRESWSTVLSTPAICADGSGRGANQPVIRS